MAAQSVIRLFLLTRGDTTAWAMRLTRRLARDEVDHAPGE